MNGYEFDDEPIIKNQNGEAYTIQYFRGKHKNEYVMRTPAGDAILYENGVTKMQWKENNCGLLHDEFVVYKRGRVDFRQSYKDIIEQNDYSRIINHKKGPRLEITDYRTGNYIYHGLFNKNNERDGWGIECDRENGKMVIEGIWSNGALIEIIRLFDGDTMTELMRNGADSLDPVKRVPIYVGGFRYDGDSETFVREGIGSLIDKKTRLAYRECHWENGKEVSGVDLHDGWYCPQPQPGDRRDAQYESVSKQDNQSESVSKQDNQTESVSKQDNQSESVSKQDSPSENTAKQDKQYENTQNKDASGNKTLCKPSHAMASKSLTGSIFRANDLNTISVLISELKVSSHSCNDINLLDLSKFGLLQSIEIGSHCFGSVPIFRIDALHKLSRLKIGRNSFTPMKSTEKFDYEKANNQSKSFHILNCESLESIEIGEWSFSDFAGDFELKNLPKLKSIQIGSMDYRSYNFYFASFIVKGIFLIDSDNPV